MKNHWSQNSQFLQHSSKVLQEVVAFVVHWKIQNLRSFRNGSPRFFSPGRIHRKKHVPRKLWWNVPVLCWIKTWEDGLETSCKRGNRTYFLSTFVAAGPFWFQTFLQPCSTEMWEENSWIRFTYHCGTCVFSNPHWEAKQVATYLHCFRNLPDLKASTSRSPHPVPNPLHNAKKRKAFFDRWLLQFAVRTCEVLKFQVGNRGHKPRRVRHLHATPETTSKLVDWCRKWHAT